MQMLSKVMRLDLQYSCEQSHHYQRQTCYLAPFADEAAEHLAKRLLSYLVLFELHPELCRHDHAGKKPDLYLQDQHQHFLLWCQVDMPNEKQLQRASHQSKQVLLVSADEDLPKLRQLSKGLTNVQFLPLLPSQLALCCQMFKGHMQWSVWRDECQLLITDGQQQLEINLTEAVCRETSGMTFAFTSPLALQYNPPRF